MCYTVYLTRFRFVVRLTQLLGCSDRVDCLGEGYVSVDLLPNRGIERLLSRKEQKTSPSHGHNCMLHLDTVCSERRDAANRA